MLLSWMFISSCTTIPLILSYRNLFFECLYFRKYSIRMYLYVFWLRKGPSIKCVRNWWGDLGGHPKCVKLHLGGASVSQNTFNFNQIESEIYSIFLYDALLWKNPLQRSTGNKVYFIVFISFKKLFHVDVYRVSLILLLLLLFLLLNIIVFPIS